MTERARIAARSRQKGRAALLIGLMAAAGAAAVGVRALFPLDREARLGRLEVSALRRLARERSTDPLIFLVLGRRLRYQGERRAAFVMTNRAYDLNDREPRFVAAMAGVLVDAGDPTAAHLLAENASARWPDSGAVRAQLSRAYAARGQFTDALREAESAARLSPGDAESWRALGNAQAQNKRPEAAFKAFAQAIRMEPRDAELLSDYGEALTRYGRPAEAQQTLERAVALAPRDPRPAGLLGRLLAERARTTAERAKARALLEQALAQAPTATDIEYALALLELRDGRPQEAIRILRACMSHDPGYGEAYLALGQAYQSAGEPGPARAAFARWRRFSDDRRETAHLELRLRRSPNDPDLRRRLEQRGRGGGGSSQIPGSPAPDPSRSPAP